MVSIFIILISILVLDHFINKSQIKKWDIEVPELKSRYVNKVHKNGEKILYWVSMIVMILAITEFHHLSILIFISPGIDRKSTRLNSSHVAISYAVFCLKKKLN